MGGAGGGHLHEGRGAARGDEGGRRLDLEVGRGIEQRGTVVRGRAEGLVEMDEQTAAGAALEALHEEGGLGGQLGDRAVGVHQAGGGARPGTQAIAPAHGPRAGDGLPLERAGRRPLDPGLQHLERGLGGQRLRRDVGSVRADVGHGRRRGHPGRVCRGRQEQGDKQGKLQRLA
jgi:hypothetical protein